MYSWLHFCVVCAIVVAIVRTSPVDLNEKCKEYTRQFPRSTSSFQWTNDTEAHLTEFPHIAALAYPSDKKYRFRCGGTLISNKYVILPAHCVVTADGIQPKFVRLGAVRFPIEITRIDPQTDYHIKTIKVHPNYNIREKTNNIALAELKEEVIFTSSIRPACLHTSTDAEDDQDFDSKLILTEWTQRDPNKGSECQLVLNKTRAIYVPSMECSLEYTVKYNKTLGENQICAKSTQNSVIASEIGGPLQIYNGRLFTVVGVQSHGGLAANAIPTVYSSVQRYFKWIKNTVWN